MAEHIHPTGPFPSAPQDASAENSEPLLAEQASRWHKGERVRVEDYLRSRPELGSRPQVILDLVYNEILLRESCGETPCLPEYQARFPELAEELQVQFEIDRVFQADTSAAPEQGARRADMHSATEPTQQNQLDICLPPPPVHSSLPQRVADYEILDVLGHGGMGVVYKARQPRLNRVVALKMIRSGMHASPEELARFRIEAEAAARLQHPNIVQVFEVRELADQTFLALEYVAGGSLAGRLDGTPWPPRPAAEFVEILARAIHHAHEHGIVHRDLKPANILLSDEWRVGSGAEETADLACATSGLRPEAGQTPTTSGLRPDARHRATPKITDFGLARMAAGAGGLTETGDFLGTPKYTAPEQAAGKVRDIGPASDVYALGAILYEMVSGRPPFQGTSALETLDLVRTQDPLPPTRLQPKLPRDLETICLKCLRKEPARRYTTALALAADLGRFLEGQPIQARPVGGLERLLKWTRRRPAAAGLIAVSIVALATVVIGSVLWAASSRASAEREAAERARAEQSFAKAMDAVQQMLTEVGAVELADVPHLGPVRLKLLHKAKKFYEEFLAERGNDTAFRYFAGRAFRGLGDIEAMLEQHADAERSYRAALDMLDAEGAPAEQRREAAAARNNLGRLLKGLVGRTVEAEALVRNALSQRSDLAKEFPEDPTYAQDVAAGYYDLATILARMPGRVEHAREAYQQALSRQEKLAGAKPTQPDLQRDRARTLNNLGILLSSRDPRAAQAALEQATSLYEALVAKCGDVPGYRRELARSCNNLAVFFNQRGERQHAETSYQEARKLLRQLTLDFSTVPIYRHELAGVVSNLGLLFDDSDRPDEAVAAYREAVRLRGELVRDFRGKADYSHSLARAQINLCKWLQQRRFFKEAEDNARQAAELLRTIARDGSPPAYHSDLGLALNYVAAAHYRRGLVLEVQALLPPQLAVAWIPVAMLRAARDEFLAARDCLLQALAEQEAARDWQTALVAERTRRHWSYLAQVLLALGDHEAAADVARMPVPKTADHHIQAVRFLCAALALAETDPALLPGERVHTRAKYSRWALELLRQAARHGRVDANLLRSDPAFRCLQTERAYQELLDELEQKRPRVG